MTNRLLNLIRLDGKLLWRNKFVHVSLIVAVLFIILINFLIPSEAKIGVAEYIFDDTQGSIFAEFLQREINSQYVVESEEQLFANIQQNPNSVGIILRGSAEKPQAIIIQQGHENPKSINLLKISLDQVWVQEGGVLRPIAHSINYLFPKATQIAFNLSLLPLFIALESVILGFYFAAVMIFQEKDEGAIKAYRISPGGAFEYIVSKVAVNVALALLSALIIVIGTVGLNAQFGKLIVLIVLAASILTLLGLGIGVFLKNLSSFIYPALIIASIMSLPMAAYLYPVFNVSLIGVITTYPVMFGLREILFPTGRLDFYNIILAVLMPQLIVVTVFCYMAVKKRLMQEVA